MAKRSIFPVVATIAIVGVVLGVFSQTVMRDANVSTNTMTTEQAYADLSSKMKRIGVQEVTVAPQQLDTISYNYAADSLSELASINEAASIVGNSEDITYKLRNLFNAEM